METRIGYCRSVSDVFWNDVAEQLRRLWLPWDNCLTWAGVLAIEWCDENSINYGMAVDVETNIINGRQLVDLYAVLVIPDEKEAIHFKLVHGDDFLRGY